MAAHRRVPDPENPENSTSTQDRCRTFTDPSRSPFTLPSTRRLRREPQCPRRISLVPDRSRLPPCRPAHGGIRAAEQRRNQLKKLSTVFALLVAALLLAVMPGIASAKGGGKDDPVVTNPSGDDN